MNNNSYQKRIQKDLFNQNDISNALFQSIYPNVKVKPFILLGRYLASIVVTLSLVPPTKPFETLNKSIVSFNRKHHPISLNIIEKLPSWIVNLIWKQYLDYLQLWYDYIQENIKEFVEENVVSRMQWTMSKETNITSVFKDELTFEQRLWIFANHHKDKGDQIKLIEDVRESLIPWMNSSSTMNPITRAPVMTSFSKIGWPIN